MSEKGGKCRKRSVVYRMSCKSCEINKKKTVYIGETGRTAFERGEEHIRNINHGGDDEEKHSVWRKHKEEKHGGENIDINMEIIASFKDDALGRQVMEGVIIREEVADEILNSREEFHRPGQIRSRN